MLYDSSVILSSIEWAISLLEEKMVELENARDYNRMEEISLQVSTLLRKLKIEEKNMDDYMNKYGKIVREK